MLKFYSLLLGENPNYVATFQPASKRKIILYANCLMVPIILWFINSFLLVSHVLDANIYISMLTGITSAFIIFLIERAIIMSSNNQYIVGFRIFLGLIVAALGSISFDEVIFKSDIDNKVAEYKMEVSKKVIKDVELQYKDEIISQKSIVEQKTIDWNKSLLIAREEADGTGGSHQKMVGAIANLKMKIADKHEMDYKKENEKLTNLLATYETEKTKVKERAEENFNGKGLLLRIRAMFDLVIEDWCMLTVYILFSLFLFSLEFLVVIIKIYSQKSIDEELEIAREILIKERTQKLLDRKALLFLPEQHMPSIKKVEDILAKKHSQLL